MIANDNSAERYREVLVLVGAGGGQEAPIRMATEAAERFDSRLTGMCAVILPAGRGGSMAATSNVRDATALLAATLGEFGSEAGLETCWENVFASREEVAGRLSERAKLADLVVVGRPPKPSSTPGDAAAAFALVEAAAGPVMFVPVGTTPACLGARVMVAWDAERAAARAVNDAMPFLRTAETVTVLSVSDDREIALSRMSDPNIADYFNSHGISIDRRQTFAGRAGAGETILSRAEETGADLLVMGATRRNKPGVATLGAATRHLLDHTMIPVLVSC